MKPFVSLAVAVASVFPSTSMAATEKFEIADLMKVDALGYECVLEVDLEKAFAVGKSVRAPRLCMVDPCKETSFDVLSREVIGTDPTSLEYDAFLRRQDNVCGGPIRAERTDEELAALVFNGSRVGRSGPIRLTSVPLPATGFLLPVALFCLRLKKSKFCGEKA